MIRIFCSLCIFSFVKQYLGAPTATDVDSIKSENESLKKRVEELTQKVRPLTYITLFCVCVTWKF